MRAAAILLFWGGLMGLFSEPARAAKTVKVVVAVEDGVLRSSVPGTLSGRIKWMGEQRDVAMALHDDGLWQATVTGPEARAVSLEIWRTDVDPIRRLSQTLEVLPAGDVTLSFGIRAGIDDSALRTSRPDTPMDIRDASLLRSVLASMWVLFGGLAVLAMGRRALSQPARCTKPVSVSWLGELGVWLLLAAAWTWPAIWPSRHIVGRHFDALGTTWVIEAADRLGFDLHDSATAWPEGVTYSTIDSWVLALVGIITDGIPAHWIHSWTAVLGVALSGFAASRLARVIGALPPSHWLAGLFYAGSGLMAGSLLEGHVYQAVNPWTPWMALGLVRASRDGAGWRDGLLAGLCFSAALFTSGYIGLSAGIVAVGLGGFGLVIARDRRPLTVAAGVGLLSVALYIALFSRAGVPGATYASIEELRLGSLTLDSLGPATAEIDRTHHSFGLAVSTLMVALALIGLRGGNAQHKVLGGVAVLCLLIAAGPQWSLGIGPEAPSVSSPIGFLWSIPEVRYLRFPGRIMWGFLAMFSALAALGLSGLWHRSSPRVGWVVLALALLETLIMVRLPDRQWTFSVESPGVYQEVDGPVFDLVGEGTSDSREADSWISAMLCQYQTQHGRPIADDCVSVGPDTNPRVARTSWLFHRLLEGDVESAWSRLSQEGYVALAVHYDWMVESSRVRLKEALAGREVFVEKTQGSGVWIYPVTPVPKTAELRSGPPTAFVGPRSREPVSWHVRVDLQINDTHSPAWYYARFGPGQDVELVDKGPLSGSRYYDRVFSGKTVVPSAVSRQVQILEVTPDGRARVMWQGQVTPLGLREDVLSFRMDEAGVVAPVLRAPDIHPLEIRHLGPLVLGVAWLMVLVVGAVWWRLTPARSVPLVKH